MPGTVRTESKGTINEKSIVSVYVGTKTRDMQHVLKNQSCPYMSGAGPEICNMCSVAHPLFDFQFSLTMRLQHGRLNEKQTNEKRHLCQNMSGTRLNMQHVFDGAPSL